MCVFVFFVLFFMCVSSWHCRRVWFDCARRNCVSMRVGFMVTLSCQTLPGNCVSMRFPDGAWTWSLCVVRLCQVIECQCVFLLLHGHSRLARCVDFAGNCVSTYMLFVFVSGVLSEPRPAVKKSSWFPPWVVPSLIQGSLAGWQSQKVPQGWCCHPGYP